MLRYLVNTDTAPGVLVIAFGVATLAISKDYQLGTLTAMGPGYMPRILGWLSVALGLMLTCRGVLGKAERLEPWPLRATGFVVSGIIAFAVLVERAGLLITAISVTVLVSLARPGVRPLPLLILAVFLALFSFAVFVLGLGLPLSAGPG